MDLFIIANAWSAGKDNPTSKHRIAIELVRQGHRVLWIEGSGMRTPSVGSSSDRLRMVRKIVSAFRGARREAVNSGQLAVGRIEKGASLHVLSPLFVPLPKYDLVRCLNGLICRMSMRFWGWRLGFKDPVLINYVPVLAEAMRCRPRRQTTDHRPQTPDLRGAQVAADVPAADGHGGGESVRRDVERHLVEASFFLRSAVSPRPPRVVYHCVDRWDAFAMYDSAMMGAMDRRCCELADLVIASAGELYERCKAINPNTVLIPHGVDWEHFRCAVPEMQLSDLNVGGALRRGDSISLGASSLHRRTECASHIEEESSHQSPITAPPASGGTIGFFGLLSEWVDQELILRLAREFSGSLPLPSGERVGVRVSSPRAQIVLIGKADVDVTRLQGVSNIQLLGPKPFSELPSHIAGFTVGIIPFVVNDLTRSVNPIKLREMLSAGCPVVSTALPEVARYAGSQTADCRPQTADLREETLTPTLSPEGRGGSASPSPFRGEGRGEGECVGAMINQSTAQNSKSEVCSLQPAVSLPAVQVAHNHDEFVAMVRQVLETPLSPEERRAVSDSMASETWASKVGEILSLITHDDGV